jgi:hypothetical protein
MEILADGLQREALRNISHPSSRDKCLSDRDPRVVGIAEESWQ